MAMDWTDVIKRVSEQDHEAMRELYDATKQHAFFIARQFVQKETDVLDILQDSYIKAFRHLAQLDEASHFEKWFHCIVGNTCRDYLRKRKPLLFSDISDDDKEIEIADDRIAFSPDAKINYEETKRLVKTMIDHLPPDQKLCVFMYYYEELSIKEIADALEVCEGTIKSRLYYARNQLKEEVLELEKTSDIKLYGVGVLPFLVWMLAAQEQETVLSLTFDGVLLQAIEKGKLASRMRHLRIRHHYVSLRSIGVVGSIVMTIGGLGILTYMEMHKFEVQLTLQDKISVEYGDSLSFTNVIAQVNEQAFLDNDTHTMEIEDYLITFDLVYDTKSVGTKEGSVTYQYEDESQSVAFTYDVEDTKPPLITLKEESCDLTFGEAFDPLSYIESVADEVDGDLLDAIEIDNPFNAEIADTYIVTYKVKDKNGLSDEKTLEVTLLEEHVKVKEALPKDNATSAASQSYQASLNPRRTGFSSLDAKVDSIIGSIISGGMSNEAKIRAIHDWVATHASYGYGSASLASLGNVDPNNEYAIIHQGLYQDAASIIFNGVGVCDNYAAAFEVLAERVGFDVVREGGQFTWPDGHTAGHMWNRILLNGTWYYVDTQGDSYDGNLHHNYYLLTGYPPTVSGNFAYYRQLDQLSSLSALQSLTGIPIVSKSTIVDRVAKSYLAGDKSIKVMIIDEGKNKELSELYEMYEFTDAVDKATNTTDHMAGDFWSEGTGGPYVSDLKMRTITFVFEH